MNRIGLLVLSILTFACSTNSNNAAQSNERVELAAVDSLDQTLSPQHPFVLYEDRIRNILLPFPRTEMLDQLKNAFDGFTVVKEVGQQDGPDFPLYTVKQREAVVVFFSMDSEDTVKLADVHVKHPLIKDQYGLQVGDSYQRIRQMRVDAPNIYTDVHQHTFAYFDHSNIMYEISGSLNLPDTADFENLKLTEEQVEDWKIETLVWRQ